MSRSDTITLNTGDHVKADPISVGNVLSQNHRFVVPIYQRTYKWTEKKQLEPLFGQIILCEDGTNEESAEGQ
jgi:uncharacterized protein with ParB-like and HNH nuclease domain